MTTAVSPQAPQTAPEGPLGVEPGDHLDQPTFHARYVAMPGHVRAELIGGVVYMPSPTRRGHGKLHARLVRWLAQYEERTPGTEALDNATIILGPGSEPQPDACLRVLGGLSRETDDDYIRGPVEFVAEVASSTASYDLHSKKDDYERFGVRECLVLVAHERRAVWFVRKDGRSDAPFVELAPGADGVLRSSVLPGLWLDVNAFFAGDVARLREVLELGCAAPEHARFVAGLKAP
jgi:Uma2 family endonuclease